MTPKNSEKITYLDGIRGVASIIVVISHVVMWFAPYLHGGPALNPNLSGASKLLFDSPFTFIYRGNSAVWLFFVLSGFVLSYNLLKQRDNIDAFRRSALKRYFRLGIPVLASVIICYLLMTFGAYKAAEFGMTGKFQLAYSFQPTFVSALTEGLFGALIYGDSKYNYVLWTISIELYGSFLVFSLIALFGKSNKLLRPLSILCCLALITSTNREYSSLALFSFGVFLATFNLPNKTSLISTIIGCALLLVGLYFCGFHPKSATYSYIAQATTYASTNYGIKGIWFNLIPQFGAMIIISSLIICPKPFKPLEARFFQWLGQISFSVYLLHTFSLTIICAYIQQYALGTKGILLSLALVLPTTLLAAHYFYIYIDRFFTSWVNSAIGKNTHKI